MDLIFVKGGTFKMGKVSYNTKPVHTVKLSDFYISKYEITNEQFCRFLNEYGSIYSKDGGNSGKSMYNIYSYFSKIRKKL